MKQILLVLTLVLILAGCASKRFVKKGMELENSGLYTDAANSYFSSLKKNINNIDAKLGLQRTGQLVLDDKIEKFKAQYQNGTAKDAVYAFRTAQSYLKQLKGVGINLLFPEEQNSYYREVEDTYLNELYGTASKALGLDQFASAEKQLAEILSINASYKDAKSKWVIAKYEPLYRNGNELMQNKMYRSAYFVFKGIVDKVSTYENSLDLMNQSLSEAKVTIYISTVNTNFTAYKTMASQLTSNIVKGVNDIKSPLYEVVGSGKSATSSTQKTFKAFLLDRTKGVVNSQVKPNSKAVFTSNLQRYNKSAGRLTKKEKRGYLKRTEEYIDKETKLKKKRTVYDKVKYYEYSLNRTVSLMVNYSMKRIDREELVLSNTYNKEEVERLNYAQFEGDYKKLVPGTWKYLSKDSDGDKVYDNTNSVSGLRKLFDAPTTPRTLAEMENVLLEDCTAQITAQIKSYQPEN